MYKVIIVEDDYQLAQTLAKIIGDVAPLFEIKGFAPSIIEAEKLIEEVKPDIAFFDVELKDGLSFDLLEKLPKIDFEIIFVTAFSHYAIHAFQFSAIDFVVKPVDPDDIQKAAEKAIESISYKNIDQRIRNFLTNKREEPANQRLMLQTAGSVYFVKMNDIIRCESDINYTTFLLAGGKSIVVSKSIGEFERILPSFFFRAHRANIINLNYVVEVKKKSGTAILSNDEKIEISSRKKEAFLQALKDHCK